MFLVRWYQIRTWWLQLVQTTGVSAMKTACKIFSSLDPHFHVWFSKGSPFSSFFLERWFMYHSIYIFLVFLVYPQCWVASPLFNFRTLSPSPRESPHPLTVTPHYPSPQPLATTIWHSVSIDFPTLDMLHKCHIICGLFCLAFST